MFMAKSAGAITGNVGEVYLTNDLGYAKENLSLIKVFCTPFNILLAGFSAFFSKGDPFKYLFYIHIASVILCTYYVFVTLGMMPKDTLQQ